MDKNYPTLKEVGENALLVEYENEVSLEVNLKVRQLVSGLEKEPFSGMEEIIFTYRSVMICFDPFQIDLAGVRCAIEKVNASLEAVALPKPRLFRIPTVYSNRHGPDLDQVARETGHTSEEVIEIFSKQAYPVYFIGFACALAYLGGVHDAIQLPRLDSPRALVPAGSVGLAGPQANIVPVDQPSGFNYIGRTFVSVYDPQEFPPTLFRPGDYIQCPAVSEKEAVAAGVKKLGAFVENIQNY